jgi:hypothetical protein
MSPCRLALPEKIFGAASATDSRSTSAGSRDSERRSRLSTLEEKLPQYEYPVSVVVRNTFIDAKVGRPESLDEFFEERRIHSCPPQHDDHDIVLKSPEPSFMHIAFTVGAQAFMDTVVAATGILVEPECQASAPSATAFSLIPPRVLVLSDALPEAGPELGTHDLPTVGSAGHSVGSCKPCAFLYTKGCENGVHCSFCHLCPPDEKRRRQKEKQNAFREMRRQRRQVRV